MMAGREAAARSPNGRPGESLSSFKTSDIADEKDIVAGEPYLLESFNSFTGATPKENSPKSFSSA